MNPRTMRLLVLLVGAGSLAGSAVAQDSDSNDGYRAERRYETTARGDEARGSRFANDWGSPAPVHSECRASRSHGSRHQFFEDDDPAVSLGRRRTRPAPQFDDESGQRSRHADVGPEPELARSEMTRLAGARTRALGRGENGDSIRRLDSEMDRLDGRAAASRRPASSLRESEPADDDRPMRTSGRRPRVATSPNRRTAPFSDDPDSDRERHSSGWDPRHATRGTSQAQESTPSPEEPARAPVKSAAKRAVSRDPETAAPTTTGGKLMAVERQLLVLRRRNASPDQIEALESEASRLRATWRRTSEPSSDESSARVSREPSGESQDETRPAAGRKSPFWRRAATSSSYGDEDEQPAGERVVTRPVRREPASTRASRRHL